MKLLIYNIAYGTGAPSALFNHIYTIHRYIKTSSIHLEKITNFIVEKDPDILGLVEIDMGSYRANFVNQVEVIANHLSHHHHSTNKYGNHFFGCSLPILKKQGNAVLTKKNIPHKNFHFFPVGFKKLIIEVFYEGIRFFLVHLSINKRIRQVQFSYLIELIKGKESVIVAGDFNTFSGEKEIRELQDKLGLLNPNREMKPTFPSWKPRSQLDFILCSENIKIKNFDIPQVKFSDHLPLLMDFEI